MNNYRKTIATTGIILSIYSILDITRLYLTQRYRGLMFTDLESDYITRIMLGYNIHLGDLSSFMIINYSIHILFIISCTMLLFKIKFSKTFFQILLGIIIMLNTIEIYRLLKLALINNAPGTYANGLILTAIIYFFYLIISGIAFYFLKKDNEK